MMTPKNAVLCITASGSSELDRHQKGSDKSRGRPRIQTRSPFKRMEAVASSSLLIALSSFNSRTPRTHLSLTCKRPLRSSQVIWSSCNFSKTVLGLCGSPLQCSLSNVTGKIRYDRPVKHSGLVLARSFLFQPLWKFQCVSSRYFSLLFLYGRQNLVGFGIMIKSRCWPEKLRQVVHIGFVRLVVGMMIIMSVSLTVSTTPPWALTEENLLFLEAWRTVDRAYFDKTFNGKSWFRYREDALRNEPMNTREETYMAIRKMLSTLDDPFTRFLEPEKFRSLRSGTQGALTGVGLSIGYPTALESSTGLVVISSSPGGPANKAGILPRDVILAIDDTSTEDMDIYDAAERLQGPEGTTVKLDIQSGSDIKHMLLTREKVALNPVNSRLCEITGSGNNNTKIGYIKLTTFNQNASGAVKDAIQNLRNNNVKSFVLDLRNNSGGLFPEGIEIAKIWLDKGVIVYICDSRGVRDIYEVEGGNAVAATEPLIVLVNKGTASASEILAGALKDNKRAVVYGEPTFGKGKIQSVFELSDGSGLAVTVARYETPAHTDIDKVGITPDHPLPASFPLDEDAFCTCLKDPDAPCNINTTKLFSR